MAAVEEHYRLDAQKDRSSSVQISDLQPLKRKLDKIETERIYRIIRRAVSNIKHALLVSWFIEDGANIFPVADKALRQLLSQHQHMVGTIIPDNEEREQELKNSLKSILRYCGEKNIDLLYYQPDDKLFFSNSIILEHFEELLRIVYERLLTGSDEEVARLKYLLQTLEKKRGAQNAIICLQQNLKDNKKEKEHIISEKNQQIQKLKHDLEFLKLSTDEENNKSLNDGTKQILLIQNALDNKRNKLTQDIISSKKDEHKSRSAHHDKESQLRKRKFKMAGELQNWILKYDQDMEWRQDQIDEITMLNRNDLEEISQIEKHFKILEKEYETVMEERRVNAEEERKLEKEQEMLKEATVRIQSVWRGYKTRKETREKRGGGKSKGRKSKGNKKKK